MELGSPPTLIMGLAEPDVASLIQRPTGTEGSSTQLADCRNSSAAGEQMMQLVACRSSSNAR
eukprot:5083038-Pleurochrysis_carterae.AAC.1